MPICFKSSICGQSETCWVQGKLLPKVEFTKTTLVRPPITTNISCDSGNNAGRSTSNNASANFTGRNAKGNQNQYHEINQQNSSTLII